MPGKERLPPPEELRHLSQLLADRFIQRWDLYAQQINDGRYLCRHQPLTVSKLMAHLKGTMTLGAYVLDKESNGRFLVLDADDDAEWDGLKKIARQLTSEGTPIYLEHSRRGGHLWAFLPEKMPGIVIRDWGLQLLAEHNLESVELFPKQDTVKEGPGSLIRLPFGIHRKSGQRYGFYDAHDQLLAPTIHEQIMLLSAPQFVQKERLTAITATVSAQKQKAEYRPIEWHSQTITDKDAPPSQRIKAAVSVADFISQYVELSGNGLGKCPFHDDKVASFAVNEDANYWSCFACETGGSVIDFWMHWRKCDFTTAVTELAKMLFP